MNTPPRTRISPVQSAITGDATGVLLMVGPSEDTARRIESFLRNAGHPLRCGWVDDITEVEDVLHRSPPDLLLCDEATTKARPREVVQLAAELRPDLPVLVVGRTYSPEEVVAALAAGAKDFVCTEDLRHLRHLELVVIREFINHHHLRTLRVTRERLEDFEQRHSQLLAGTADAVAHVQEGILSHVNPAFAKLLQRADSEELVGQPLIDLVVEDQRSRVKERLRQLLKGKHNGEPMEFSFAGAGSLPPISINAQLILGTDNGERVIEMLIRSADVTPAEVPPPAAPAVAVTAAAPAPAAVSSAKGSGGRVAFLRTIATAPPADAGVRGALLLVVDGFAALEDRVGMTSGEEIVEQLATALRARLGSDDQVFQFSAGELAAVVSKPRVADVEALGELLRGALSSQIYATSNNEAQLTLSIVVYPLNGKEKPDAVVQEIVQEARRLSQKGGNQLALLGSTAKASQSEREDARKAALVKKALEENRLKLAYQSIASLEGDSRQHFDVLVRMMDENGKELYAGEFLPSAERFGMMRSIDRWVLARCLGIVAKRSVGKDPPSLFVRLSEDTLKDTEGFLRWLTELLRAHPLKSEEFVFEVQEAVLQNHIRKAKALIEGLTALGAGLAVDHFGMSPNSAQLIDHLPRVGFLKFHASYTQKFADKDVQRRLTQLMDVAKQKKIKTIVSHVEDANVMARLWQMGVNFIQGYHIQEPEVVLLASEIITQAISIHAPR